MGKTTLAKTVAHFAAENHLLGASFFCSRDLGHGSIIFPTLAFQLSRSIPKFAAELFKVIEGQGDICGASPSEQFLNLIIKPLRTIGSHSHPGPILIVIDALDECEGNVARSSILMALSQYLYEAPPLKVFVTSRPEAEIRNAFHSGLRDQILIQYLHAMDQGLVDRDIRLFLEFRLREIARDSRVSNLPADWPPSHLVEQLVRKASGSFMFASTICKFIDPKMVIEQQIAEIAQFGTSDGEAWMGIDRLYRKVLELAISNLRDEEVAELRSLLGFVLLLQGPLSVRVISQLLCRTPIQLIRLLEKLHNVLIIPQVGDEDGFIRPLHMSFRDFLTDPTRCGDPRILVQPVLQHGEIAICLLNHMMRYANAKILDSGGQHSEVNAVDDPNVETKNLPDRRERRISGPFPYACRYWADHLTCASTQGGEAEGLTAALDGFVRSALLRWIEMLSQLENMAFAASALQKARSWHSVQFIYIPLR
jgi:hypothetical protein